MIYWLLLKKYIQNGFSPKGTGFTRVKQINYFITVFQNTRNYFSYFFEFGFFVTLQNAQQDPYGLFFSFSADETYPLI